MHYVLSLTGVGVMLTALLIVGVSLEAVYSAIYPNTDKYLDHEAVIEQVRP